jgi:DNA-binding MarR family transcriptional regulator
MTEEEELEARDFFWRNYLLIDFEYWSASSNVRMLSRLEELGLVALSNSDNVRVRAHLTPLGEAYRKVLNLR